MADLFSSDVLTRVVNSLQTAPRFLLDMCFPTVQTETAEEVHFDVENDVMGLAPFVSPLVEGKVLTNLGYTTKTFKPAYVKPKRVFSPNEALKRRPGEPIGGNLSPQQRMDALVAMHLRIDRESIERRLELMAATILRTGAITISGDQYPEMVVSFGRNANLSINLTGANRWDQSGVNPLNDLQTWADLMLQYSGSPLFAIVMDVGAWKVFRAHADVQKRLETQRVLGQMPSMSQDAIMASGGSFKGFIDNIGIYAYAGFYKADNGDVTRFLPDGSVIGIGDLAGVQAYGAIQDEEAGLQALPFFAKSWLEKDPGRRFVMTQSAPLLVPFRPNASFYAKVLNAA